jgi:hypothetical protein
MIDGVEYVGVGVNYFDNGYSTGIPTQDPSTGSVTLSRLQSLVDNDSVMLSDQVKLAVVNQSGLKKVSLAYVTDSLSSTIGTVQDIFDLLG